MDFGPDSTPQIVAACQEGLAAAAEALSTALDGRFELALGEPGSLDTDSLPEHLQGPGLAFVLKGEQSGAAVLLMPEARGLIPPWFARPSAEELQKLQKLAQELGAALLPAELQVTDHQAGWLDNLAEAVTRGGIAAGSTLVPISMGNAQEQNAVLSLIWPVTQPDELLPPQDIRTDTPVEPEPPPVMPDFTPPADNQPARLRRARDIDEAIDDLPSYTRSLLKIEVPIVVTLANAKQPLTRILSLVPGTLLQFDKSCEEPLQLEIGQQQLAIGEAVKIGDKFGLRLTSMTLPQEKLGPIKGHQQQQEGF